VLANCALPDATISLKQEHKYSYLPTSSFGLFRDFKRTFSHSKLDLQPHSLRSALPAHHSAMTPFPPASQRAHTAFEMNTTDFDWNDFDFEPWLSTPFAGYEDQGAQAA